MVWKTAVIVIALFVSSCGSLRDFEICKPDFPGNKNQCAKNDKKYEKPLDYVDKNYCVNEISLRIIANKLEQCERDAEELKACQMGLR